MKMNMIQVVAFAMGLSAAAAGAGLRAGSREVTAPLAPDAGANKLVTGVDLSTRMETDKLLHLLVEDEKKADSDSKKDEDPLEADVDAVAKTAEKDGKKLEKDVKDMMSPQERSTKKARLAELEFVSACLDHTHKMVENLDRSYTDMQLKTVLENECHLSKEFPLSHNSHFDTHEACMSFAETLTEARHEELADKGDTKGYKTFCQKFYETQVKDKSAPLSAEKTELEEIEGFILLGGGLTAVALFCLVGCCLLAVIGVVMMNKKNSREPTR